MVRSEPRPCHETAEEAPEKDDLQTFSCAFEMGTRRYDLSGSRAFRKETEQTSELDIMQRRTYQCLESPNTAVGR